MYRGVGGGQGGGQGGEGEGHARGRKQNGQHCSEVTYLFYIPGIFYISYL